MLRSSLLLEKAHHQRSLIGLYLYIRTWEWQTTRTERNYCEHKMCTILLNWFWIHKTTLSKVQNGLTCTSILMCWMLEYSWKFHPWKTRHQWIAQCNGPATMMVTTVYTCQQTPFCHFTSTLLQNNFVLAGHERRNLPSLVHKHSSISYLEKVVTC